nr:NADH dehydrogenase subunit 6 [Cardiastethus sp.]
MDIMFLSIMSIMIFMWTKHPISMGLMLIIQTLIISMISGLMINLFWFSYMLLITMLSGMLVLFIYMSSIASNEKFNFSPKMMLTVAILPLCLMMDKIINNKMIMPELNKSMNYIQSTPMLNMFNDNAMITIMMIMYLLFTMICVTYIVNIYEGPMKQKS